MKLIKTLEELIEEEIHDAKKYAKMANEYKDSYPGLAQTFYNLSVQEEEHKTALHGEVVKMINDHRRTHGAPPPEMQAIYDFLHQRHIEKAEEVKRYQNLFRG
jgi:ferritin